MDAFGGGGEEIFTILLEYPRDSFYNTYSVKVTKKIWERYALGNQSSFG